MMPIERQFQHPTFAFGRILPAFALRLARRVQRLATFSRDRRLPGASSLTEEDSRR